MGHPYPSSNAITALRIFAIAGVVLFHCNFTHPILEENLATDIIHFLTVDLGQVFTPFFFFLSGLLFFRNIEANMIRKLRSRLWTLLVPYLCWNAIAAILLLVKCRLLTDGYPQYATVDLAFPALLKGLWSLSLIGLDVRFPYDFVLWFVRDLLVVVPISCLAYKVAGLRPWLVLLLAAAFALSRGYDDFGIIASFCFFYAGGIAEKQLRSAPVTAALRRHVALRAALLCGIPLYLCRYSLFAMMSHEAFVWIEYPLTLWILCGFFVTAESLCRKEGRLTDSVTARALFFIYAAHGLWVNAAARFVYVHLPNYGNVSVLSGYVLLFATLWYVNLMAFVVLDRLSPLLTSLLCGRRSLKTTKMPGA